MTPPQAQEAEIDFEEARRIAETWERHGTAADRYIVSARDDRCGALARAYLALLATHEGEKASERDLRSILKAWGLGDSDAMNAYMLPAFLRMFGKAPAPESPPVEAE